MNPPRPSFTSWQYDGKVPVLYFDALILVK